VGHAAGRRQVKCLPPPRARRDWLGGEFVLVEQTAEPVATAEAIELQLFCARCRCSYRRWLRERRPLAERAVGPVLVVMRRVDVDDAVEVAPAEDEQPVKAFAPETADPTLGMCACPRRPHWRPDHAHAFGAEDLVEGVRELAVAVADQEADAMIAEVEAEVARLLG